MPHHNTTYSRTLKKAQQKGRLIPVDTIVARTVMAAPAPEPAPAPAVADEPAADYRHGTPPWPLNESDIDLPTEPPPSDPAPDPAPTGLHYYGAVRVHFAGIPGDCDLEVMALPPGRVIIGPLCLDVEQGMRLGRMLLAGLGALTTRRPAP